MLLHTLSACLSTVLFVFGLRGTGVLAADDSTITRLANRTIERTVQLRTHSVFAPYIDQDLQNRWWDFGADSYVNTNKHIRLTRARSSQMGWLWSRLPVTAPNYIIEAEFKVSGESTHLFGDGLAIWLTKGRAQPGPVFGNIDKFEGLGIFLDTYANARHPYSFPRISAMLGDGLKSYDQANDGEGHSIGGCSANFRRTNVATKLKITYVKDKWLDVAIQYKAWDEWTPCFSIKDISLPSAPFLGFSAMTGDVSDAHDIIGVATYSAILSAENAPRDKMRPFFVPASSSVGSWSYFFLKVLILIGFCAGGWYGWNAYQHKKRYGGYGGYGGGFGAGSASFGSVGGGNRGFNSGGGMYSSSKRF